MNMEVSVTIARQGGDRAAVLPGRTIVNCLAIGCVRLHNDLCLSPSLQTEAAGPNE